VTALRTYRIMCGQTLPEQVGKSTGHLACGKYEPLLSLLFDHYLTTLWPRIDRIARLR
jgi:hypothetical protein